MLLIILSLVFLILFGYLTAVNFRQAFGLFLISLPTYLIRFKFHGLPTTFLELELAVLILVWLIKYLRVDWCNIKKIIVSYKNLFIGLAIFFVTSLVSVFVSGFGDSNYWHMTVEALGQWRAYFLEPIILFLIIIARSLDQNNFSPSDDDLKNRLTIPDLVWYLLLSTVSISVVGILQKFWPAFYPPQLWDDVLDGRVTSFFTTPNAIGLYIAPLLFLAINWLVKLGKISLNRNTLTPSLKLWKYFWLVFAISFLALLAIGFSRSDGAIVALAAGLVVWLFLLDYKKITVVLVLLAMAGSLYVPKVRNAVFFSDPSGQNRLKLWSYSAEFLTNSPTNFIFGAGIRKFFDKVQKPYFDNKKMEALLYPHNFVLNFWCEIGLVGMLSFLFIIGYLFYCAWQVRRFDRLWGASLLAALVVWCVHGLVDVPYFKNDLAILFWVLATVVLLSQKNYQPVNEVKIEY